MTIEIDAKMMAVIEKTAETTARKTCRHFLTGLGIDVKNPLEAQADFGFLRSVRETAEALQRKSFLAAVGVVVVAVLALIWIGLKASIKQ